MSEQATSEGPGTGLAPVRREITVEVPVQRAFSTFTEHQGGWWPPDYHIGAEAPEAIVVEPRQGGRWYERAADGTECDWGRVLVWEPPHRVVLSWQISPEWRFEPDKARGSEVEVSFTPAGPATTRVRLEHRGFERHRDGGASMREAVGGPSGWAGVLDAFAKAV